MKDFEAGTVTAGGTSALMKYFPAGTVGIVRVVVNPPKDGPDVMATLDSPASSLLLPFVSNHTFADAAG